MTNWADLIDTDPVGAFKQLEPHLEGWGTDHPLDDRPHVARLLSNLAALCEEMAAALSDVATEEAQRVADEYEANGEQRIPCFFQVEWIAKARAALARHKGREE